MTDHTILQDKSDTLRREAVSLLNGLFGLPEDTSSQAVVRFVDCVISAAILEVAAIQKQANHDR